ncbi:hypothetical protein BJV85_002919 [Clostridium acetobutylicum]|nr:hypothetical protein [Clostridium acetobutylicum]NOW15571.1 hypothetical protein [Clostridium acetobutylicum]NSA93996.1 hypothetical protein [Clostridium acetobutylicum]
MDKLKNDKRYVEGKIQLLSKYIGISYIIRGA